MAMIAPYKRMFWERMRQVVVFAVETIVAVAIEKGWTGAEQI